MNYKNINDYEILYMIKENDDYAESIIYKKYLPIIKKIASKYTAFIVNRGADYEDLVQEGIIGLSRAITGYRDDQNAIFYTYACLCIERQINVFCRDLSSKKNEVLNNCMYSEDVLNMQSSKYQYSNPEEVNLEQLDYQEFIKCKNYFDIDKSSVFELRYNGFTYKEISNLLDISISTVDGRLSKIRQTLHRLGKNLI
ncbi:MAG: sigma-70 family RNA polymerase sigma factor [Bacilli bacterium]|nr:sigma-70 family RNA polymerase sigma factor [Bacilli bacterium]